jgi:hypothetical protein
MSNLANGRKTVATAGTAVQLGPSEAVSAVSITAFKGNTGVICVGGKGVIAAEGTRTGKPLLASESVSIPTDDVGDVYIDATVNGEGVSWLAVTEA